MFYSKHIKHHVFTQCLLLCRLVVYYQDHQVIPFPVTHAIFLGCLTTWWTSPTQRGFRTCSPFQPFQDLGHDRISAFLSCGAGGGNVSREWTLGMMCWQVHAVKPVFFGDGIFEGKNSSGENLQSSRQLCNCVWRRLLMFVIQRWDSLISARNSYAIQNQLVAKKSGDATGNGDRVSTRGACLLTILFGGGVLWGGSKSGFRNHFQKFPGWPGPFENFETFQKNEVWEWSWQFQNYANLTKMENHNKRRPGFTWRNQNELLRIKAHHE